MGKENGFEKLVGKERKSLSFYKIFQSGDLSSETMRALPCNFVKRIPEKDSSYKMEIKAKWGRSWEIEISKNPRVYYMEKLGWNKFVSDNALGDNDFVTFTHSGKMRFSVNIYEKNGKEIVRPRKPPSQASSSKSKKEQEENIYKDVKKEEEICETIGRMELAVTKKKTTRSKKKVIKSKKAVNDVETVGIKAGKKKAKETEASNKKQIMVTNVVNGVPEFTLTIKMSYLKFLGLPKEFVEAHIIPYETKIFKIHHPDGKKGPWKTLGLVTKARTIFSRGWSQLAREYPLLVGDIVTFKLVKPTEFIVYKMKVKEETTP